MTSNTWEDSISLNPSSDEIRAPVGRPRDFVEETITHPRLHFEPEMLAEALGQDEAPIPATADREGYYGSLHFQYWLSGLRDMRDTVALHDQHRSAPIDRYLDFGGATGRVCRHFRYQYGVERCYIGDINRRHVNWVAEHFAGDIAALQTLSLPILPFEDNFFDLVTAYSVFSHIETFDDTWLAELRRILRPGGLLIATANVDNWQRLDETWPAYKALRSHPDFDPSMLRRPLPIDRKVFRWSAAGSYSSIVFLSERYVRRRWSPIFEIVDIVPQFPQYQTGVVFRK